MHSGFLRQVSTRRNPLVAAAAINKSVVSTTTAAFSNLRFFSAMTTTTNDDENTPTKGGPSERASSVASFKVMDVLRRANQLQAAGHTVVHCEVGQPETGAPSTVAQAAVEALQEPQVMGYTDAFGLVPLRQKIAQQYRTKYNGNVDIDPSRIVVTTGSSGGFLLAFTACFDVEDVVAIASSGYPCYRNILSALGCTLCHIPVNAHYKITATELLKEIQRRHENNEKPLSGLILSSPSNPTGAMLDPTELEQLCAVCDEHGIQFLSDEIYHGISYGKPEATALEFSNNAMVLNSFSKYYSSAYSLLFVVCCLLFVCVCVVFSSHTCSPCLLYII